MMEGPLTTESLNRLENEAPGFVQTLADALAEARCDPLADALTAGYEWTNSRSRQ